MNKFRKLGFIEYDGCLHVHNSLLSVVLRDSRDGLTVDCAGHQSLARNICGIGLHAPRSGPGDTGQAGGVSGTMTREQRDSKFWRALAEQARIHADEMVSQEGKVWMLEIARLYGQLADREAKREAGRVQS
jgi:hypothetical protein